MFSFPYPLRVFKIFYDYFVQILFKIPKKNARKKIFYHDDVQFYIKELADCAEPRFKCSCGVERAKINGWSNLKSHIDSKHPERSVIQKSLNSETKEDPLDSHFKPSSSLKARNICNWIEWIVTRDLPFSFIDDNYKRKFTIHNLESICSYTLQTYMEKAIIIYS